MTETLCPKCWKPMFYTVSVADRKRHLQCSNCGVELEQEASEQEAKAYESGWLEYFKTPID